MFVLRLRNDLATELAATSGALADLKKSGIRFDLVENIEKKKSVAFVPNVTTLCTAGVLSMPLVLNIP